MKVLNYTTSYFAIFLLLIISIWAALFYYSMLDEIYDSIDDGLDNQKGLVIEKATFDSSILHKSSFDENDFAVAPIDRIIAQNFRDKYSDTTMYMQNEKDFEPVRLLTTVFRQGDHYYRLQVATSMVEEDDLMKALFYSVVWLYAGLVITILLINNLLLKKIWAPFYQLIKQVNAFRLEQMENITTRKTKIDEFNLLNQTVHGLLQHNIDAYSAQKQFIENVSHELQTPLSITINKIESLAENNNVTAEQASLINTALENLDRLARMNKTLLLLFKIENNLFAGRELVNVNTLAKQITADFSELLEYNQLSLTIEENASLEVEADANLFRIMLTNLLKNAITHNYPGGIVKIKIDKEAFAIQNTSHNGPLPRETLFSRSKNLPPAPGSTGLGLAIIKAISDKYGFHIHYTFSQAQHVFSLEF